MKKQRLGLFRRASARPSPRTLSHTPRLLQDEVAETAATSRSHMRLDPCHSDRRGLRQSDTNPAIVERRDSGSDRVAVLRVGLRKLRFLCLRAQCRPSPARQRPEARFYSETVIPTKIAESSAFEMDSSADIPRMYPISSRTPTPSSSSSSCPPFWKSANRLALT
jgi:hypothetical protein